MAFGYSRGYWERSGDESEPPLVVLHGYGRGLASPLFEAMLPALGHRRVLIVDCGWLLVTRVPLSEKEFKQVPSVKQLAAAISVRLKRRTLRGSACQP